MYCSKCGLENPEDAKICLSCGQSLPSSLKETAVETSALAGCSFALAILSLCPCIALLALPALIFGIVSLVKISRSQSKLKGTGFAVAGIAISSVGVLFVLPMAT